MAMLIEVKADGRRYVVEISDEEHPFTMKHVYICTTFEEASRKAMTHADFLSVIHIDEAREASRP